MTTFSDKFSSGLATLKLEVTTQSQSIANNTSYLKCVLKITKNKACTSHNSGGATVTMTINGTKLYSSSSFSIQSLGVGNTKTLATKYITVAHNIDGTKSVSCKGYLKSGVGLGTASISGTFTCTRIPREVKLTSAPNFNDEQNPTITYNNVAGKAVTSLQACISLTGATDDIKYRNISILGTGYKFTLTEAERNILRQACTTSNSRTVYFYVKTILDGKTFYNKLARTLNIINATPQINFSTDDIDYADVSESTQNTLIEAMIKSKEIESGQTIDGDQREKLKNQLKDETKKIIVQGKSDLQIEFPQTTTDNVIAKKYASISKYVLKLSNGITKEITNSTSNKHIVKYGAINSVSDLTLSLQAVDSRGNYSNTITKTIPCYPYFAPRFQKNPTVKRGSNETSPESLFEDDNNTGGDVIVQDVVIDYRTYAYYKFGINYAPIKDINYLTITVKYTPQGSNLSSGQLDYLNKKNKSGIYELFDYVDEISINSTYMFKIIVTDIFGARCESTAIKLLGVEKIFNVPSDGIGIAFGKAAEISGVFECKWNAKFNGDFRVEGDSQFDGQVIAPHGVSTTSDIRTKQNIKNINMDNLVDKLQSVQYQLINSTDEKVHYGFIAQDVIQALQDLDIDPETTGIVDTVTYKNTSRYALVYTEFIPLLVNKCQSLQAEVNALHQEIADIKNLIT